MSFNMYICPECRKVYKINGFGKKAKCPKCSDAILVDTGMSEDAWKLSDAIKKKDIVSGLLDEKPISKAETKHDEPLISSSDKLEEGKIINNTYKVLKPIGEGGSGEVYLAWHINLKKDVVIKRIKDDFVGKVNERSEADILKKLHHRYLPQVYDFIQNGKEVYTVMDYIDGNTLKDYIDAKIRFNEQQIIKWLKQLCEALDYLHTQTPAIIHSDIKPSNIMIDTNGDIRLIDFNISFDEDDVKQISGYTASYASPEQILKAQTYSQGGNYRDIKLDAKSDIFSLGASIYHILTLQNPIDIFKNNRPVWDVNIVMPYSGALSDIIDKSLKRDPNERYRTAADMLRDLETIKIRDKRLKNLRRDQMVCSIIAIVFIIFGGLITARGLGLRNEEGFDAEYQRIVDEAYEDDYDKSINEALLLLNNKKYASVLKKRNEKHADLQYVIANAYFEKEEYDKALPFYENAISAFAGNSEYYRDCAIAYARLKKFDEAQNILAKGTENDMEDPDLWLVNAEIENQKGNWDNAIEGFNKVIDTSTNDNTLGRAYLLRSRAYASKGDLKEARDSLPVLGTTISDNWKNRILREEGRLCMQIYENDGYEPNNIRTALSCYDKLTRSGTDTLSDWLNYALVKKWDGIIDNAISVLSQAEEKYPNEYIIPVRMATFEIEKQASLSDDEKDYSMAKEYYDKAEELYGTARNAGESNEELQQLEILAQNLREKGLF